MRYYLIFSIITLVIKVIDLLKLNYEDKIDINEEVEIPKDYYENTDIVDLSKVKTNGFIKYDADNNYLIKLDVFGTMKLHDSVTYDLVDYDFKIEIEETLENSVKTLDLIEFLWHYIVLEVPLRFTSNEGKYEENENFRVISEEEYQKKNNPFSDFSISE